MDRIADDHQRTKCGYFALENRYHWRVAAGRTVTELSATQNPSRACTTLTVPSTVPPANIPWRSESVVVRQPCHLYHIDTSFANVFQTCRCTDIQTNPSNPPWRESARTLAGAPGGIARRLRPSIDMGLKRKWVSDWTNWA